MSTKIRLQIGELDSPRSSSTDVASDAVQAVDGVYISVPYLLFNRAVQAAAGTALSILDEAGRLEDKRTIAYCIIQASMSVDDATYHYAVQFHLTHSLHCMVSLGRSYSTLQHHR